MTGDLYLLESSPLGLATNPRGSADADRCRAWIYGALAADSAVMVLEVVRYEVRRELLRAGKARGLQRLDDLVADLGHFPIVEAAWGRAAELWAEARRSGRPTARDEALDADLLIAAVAQPAAEDGWRVVVTDNAGHLARFADARDWRDLASGNP